MTGLHDTAATRGTCEPASWRDCSAAPARGGSNTTASKPPSSLAPSGRRPRSRSSVVTRRIPWLALAPRASAASAAASVSTAWTSPCRAKRSAKAPDPENRSAMRRAPARCADHPLGHCGFRRCHRLQETAGRRGDGSAAEIDRRTPRLEHHLAVDRQPGKACGQRERRSCRAALVVEAAAPEAATSAPSAVAVTVSRKASVRGASSPANWRSDGSAATERRFGDRTFDDVDDVVRQSPVVAEQHPAAGPPCRQTIRRRLAGAQATIARERRLDAFAPQRLADLVPLPGEIGARLELLQRAAPAAAEMPARRGRPAGTRA